MRNTVAKCWLNCSTSRSWDNFRVRKKDFHFQRKILVGWPRISTEASQVGHSVTWDLSLDLRDADYPISSHSKTVLKFLPLKLFQHWCFGDISPSPICHPRYGRWWKYSHLSSKFATNVNTNSPEVIQIDYIGTALLTTGPEDHIFLSHLYKPGWKWIKFPLLLVLIQTLRLTDQWNILFCLLMSSSLLIEDQD